MFSRQVALTNKSPLASLTILRYKNSLTATRLPLVLQRLDSRGIKVFILIHETILNCRYDLIILLPIGKCFLMLGNRKIYSQMVPNQENMEGNQVVKPQSRISAIASTDIMCRSIVLVKQDPRRQLSRAVSEMSQVLLFKVLNYLSSVDLSGRKQCS